MNAGVLSQAAVRWLIMQAHERTVLVCGLAILSAVVACSLNPQPEPPLTPEGQVAGAAGTNTGMGGGAMSGGSAGMAGGHEQGGEGQGGLNGGGGSAGSVDGPDAGADASSPSDAGLCPCLDPDCEAGADADWDALCACEAGEDAPEDTEPAEDVAGP